MHLTYIQSETNGHKNQKRQKRTKYQTGPGGDKSTQKYNSTVMNNLKHIHYSAEQEKPSWLKAQPLIDILCIAPTQQPKIF